MIRMLRRRLTAGEEGIALVMVVGVGMVVMLLLATVLSVSTSGAMKSARDRDFNNAMAAAYAGLADYQSHVTADNGYVFYGAATSFSATSTYSGTASNPAFGTGTSGTWAALPGGSGQEAFRYEVDNSDFRSNGIVHVRVTGRAGTATRSLVADLKGDGFINYLYFTDYESQDPTVTGETQSGNSRALCVNQHLNDPSYDSSTACGSVQFITGDALYGPVRTNDELTICGASFYSTVQSTSPDGVYASSGSSASCPKIAKGTVTQVQSIDMPQTNSNMIQETRYDIPATVPRPGCLYTGPTSITYDGKGNMTVVSPWTKATQITAGSTGVPNGGQSTGAAAAQCGSLTALHSTTGATIPQIPANLVYVQNVPLSGTGDPNGWDASATPVYVDSSSAAAQSRPFCSVTTKRNGTSTTVYGDGLGYPQTNEYTGGAGASGMYGCRNGDAFVSGVFGGGTVPGNMTIGAQNYLYVTGSITYSNPQKDILGLVGQKAVTVWNPVQCTSYSSSSICSTSQGSSVLLARSGGDDVTIDAAIASNAGTFQVQNYAYGDTLGQLTVLGSIAQKYRGAVGTSYGSTCSRRSCTPAYQTGFTKSYGYDSRLQSTAPPKFLQPVSTSYGITTQVEVSPAYTAAGAPTS